MKPLNWAYLQTFVAVAENGSLVETARSVGGSPPTMSRHISTLEDELGILLFERTGSGLVLTSAGLDLLEHARTMSSAAKRFSLSAAGKNEAIAGTVRITASQIVATYVLPPIFAKLRIAEPEITIELVATDDTKNLLLRDADIAVRMYQPTQNDVITKKIGEVKTGMFASKVYLHANRTPKSLSDVLEHSVIGYDRSTQIIEEFSTMSVPVDRSFFSFLCDDEVVCWNMVKAGHGIGFNQIGIGKADTSMVQLVPEIALPELSIWLTAHAELKNSRRVRKVYDFLGNHLGLYCRESAR